MNPELLSEKLPPLDLEPRDPAKPHRVVIAGNPNTGKTSLFNALTGLRAKTANYPGTTVERRVGRMKVGDIAYDIQDLPGIYDLSPTAEDERVAIAMLMGEEEGGRPDAAIIVVDATTMDKSLFLATQVIGLHIPCVMAMTMMDLAEARHIQIDIHQLSRELKCPVVEVNARTGVGADALRAALHQQLAHRPQTFVQGLSPVQLECGACSGCPYQKRYDWVSALQSRCSHAPKQQRGALSEKIDAVATHPLFGVGLFHVVMLAVFYLIFELATIPMDLIDGTFAHLGTWVGSLLPDGLLRSLVVDGIIAGVGGILIFLPQICILFFILTLLEDSGYLSRAVFVMERIMRRIGLPGSAFVPLLSAHACAIPAIMGSRVIQNKRDRLLTILVAPLMTCSARIPVYVMMITLLLPDRPFIAAAVFAGCYALGVLAALAMAALFRRTILPGRSKPMVIELPDYRWPSMRTAMITTFGKGLAFVQQAGTIILMISVILWVLATFPRSELSPEVVALQEQAVQLAASGEADAAKTLELEAGRLERRDALSQSLIGQVGRFIEPAVEPLGYDWQIGIGIITSFAAREVIVSTLAIVYGVGEDRVEEDENSLYDSLRRATREDGTPVYTAATCASLLVFYILAMQCLPTQAVTKKETNSWRWPIFQFGYMSVLAYVAAFGTYRLCLALGL